MATTHHSGYRAEIDGLRAIAVLAVMFFHADLGFKGGYVGVDVFFVISGYLITRLILDDIRTGQFRLWDFWARRVRRIFPALALVVFSTLVAGWFLFLPDDFAALGRSAIAQSLLISNVHFWRESGYFDQPAEIKPLLHTWSLAVEEQFYLLFPFLLIVLRRFSQNTHLRMISVLAVVSFGLSIYCSYSAPSANFYLLPTRAWELLIGSFLAAIPSRFSSERRMQESLSVIGALAIAWAVFFYDRETRFPGASAILPCGGAGLIVWSNRNTLTVVGKILTAGPLVFIGKISYSLYLWHWPLLVFTKYWTLGSLLPGHRVFLLLGSIGVGALSWLLVEIPFRKRSIFKTRSQILAFGGLSMAVICFMGLVIRDNHGVVARIPQEALQYAKGINDRAFLIELGLKEVQRGEFIELGNGNKQLPIDLLVWGDSHAMAIMPAIDFLCKNHGIRGVAATHSSTAPLVGFKSTGRFALKEESIPFGDAIIEYIQTKGVRNVLLVGTWGSYVVDEDIAPLRLAIDRTARALKGANARVWIMKSVPQHRWSVPRALVSGVFHGRKAEDMGLPLAEHLQTQELQEKIFGANATDSATILDPTTFFLSEKNVCRIAEAGKALYCDEQHLSVAGAMMLRPLFDPIFNRLLMLTPSP